MMPLLAVALLNLHHEEMTISEAKHDKSGIVTHEVRSPYQSGTTKIRVLLPSIMKKRHRHPVIYVLPVEAKDGARYGNGMLEVKKLGLHDKLDAIFVQPTFSHLPWYADHPTDHSIRQETYLLKVVLPFIERSYPVVASRKGRLLLGFSKSGWGAWSLLLRHPDVFEKAVAWDAPLLMDKPNRYGSGPIFGTQKNFEKYRITALIKSAKSLGAESRLALIGICNFGKHHEEMHETLKKHKVPHLYRKERKKKHTWDAGWVEAGARFLLNDK